MCIKNFRFLILFSVIALLAPRGVCADTADQMFQDGLFLEYSAGDLKKAIESYEKVLRNGYEDEELAAKTLLRLGVCYERVSRDEDAKNAYQQIISNFPGQKEPMDQAIKRLQKLSSGLVGDGYWFRYKGAHVYLIGAGTASIYAGSGLESGKPVTDDPVRDWKEYIDLLIQHRVNLVRFHPWDFLNRSEVPDYACPWVKTDDKPTYDLKKFNNVYWGKLRAIMSYANARDVFFEIVLFDDNSPWSKHPFNRNHGGALKDRNGYHNLKNRRNKENQERYVAKTISETVEFPNVIYEICDAVGWPGKPLTSSMQNWISHWIEFIDKRLPAFSKHPITISQHSWSSGGKLDTLWKLPGIDIISVHEKEGTSLALGKEYTHNNFLKYWRSDYKKPIMINEVSFGDMKSHPSGGTRGWAEERQHLWAAFASGGHASRTDFQPFVNTYPSLDACLRLADFVRQVKFWEMSPFADFTLDCDGVCYGIASGEEFVLYIRGRAPQGSGKIKLKLPEGAYDARWYDPVEGRFLPDTKAVDGGAATFDLPGTATDVVLYVKKVGGG